MVVSVNIQNRIAAIKLNRPEKSNALNAELASALRKVLKEIALNDNVDIVILQGEGKHFCAGGDIQAMCEMALSPYDENFQDALLLAKLMYELYTFAKPTIALAHGATMGGGLGFLCAADIVLAADNASFAFSEVKVGITPSTISPYVIAAIGERYARYYFLTGETFDAMTAKQMGLVHEIAPSAELFTQGFAKATQLAQNNLKAMIAAKKLVREMAMENITGAIKRDTAGHLAKMRATSEAQEGLKAFVEKRKPRWSKT